jgi:penicillin-binding protein 1B
LQLAGAYAAFVNDGRRVEPKVIAGVGEYSNATAANILEPTVISPTTAYMITNMLMAVVDHGTGRAARGAVTGTAIAGKTGTSRDGWFIGYSPNLVCAVWIGFDDNSQLGMTGAAAALPVWTEFMNSAIALRPELGGRAFECPEGIKFVETDVESGLLSTLSCPHRELVALTDRLAPNFECYNHRNLPGVWTDPAMDSEAVETSSLAQHVRPKTTALPFHSLNSATTRVDTDSRGRRTLINDLR